MFTTIYQTVTTLTDLKSVCKNTFVEMGDYFVGYWECLDGQWRWFIHTGDEDDSRCYTTARNFLRYQPEIARMLREGEFIAKLYAMDRAAANTIYNLTDEAA